MFTRNVLFDCLEIGVEEFTTSQYDKCITHKNNHPTLLNLSDVLPYNILK